MIDLTKYQYGDYISSSNTNFGSSNYLESAVIGKVCIAIPTCVGNYPNEITIADTNRTVLFRLGLSAGPVKFKMPTNAKYAAIATNECPATLWYQP